MVLILRQIRRSENYWPKRSSTPSRQAQTKYLYSLDRNNNERFGDQGLFAISREIELLRYIPAEPKWKLFRVSARRKKYSSTARTQWSIFAIVKETENSQAAFASSPRTSSEKRRIYSRTEMSRCEWCLDKFSTKRYTDATVVLKRASETLGVEKKKNYRFIQYLSRKNSRRAVRSEAFIGERRDATRRLNDARDRKTFALHTNIAFRITLMAFLIAVGEFRSWCNLNFPVPALDISVIFHLCVIVWKVRRVMRRFRSGCSRLITVFCPVQTGPRACDFLLMRVRLNLTTLYMTCLTIDGK